MSADHKELKSRLRAVHAAERSLDERENLLNAREAHIDNEEHKQEHRTGVNPVEAEMHTDDDSVSRMEILKKQQDSKIRLNVGGHVFTTSIQTLQSDPETTLAAMFSGRHDIRQDESDGCCFIDRDGSHFRFVLNYLRDGSLDATTLPGDKQSLRELLREARYYKMSGLVECIKRTEIEQGSAE